MKAAARLALCIPFLACPVLAACAGGGGAAKQPQVHEAPTPRADGHTQLERTLDTLKQPGANAEKDTRAAQSVVDALRGAAQMQRDAGLTDH